MKNKRVPTFAITGVILILFIGLTLLAQQDRYALRAPDGLAFSEFKGYDTWQTIAVSETKTSVKAILGNPTMIDAYQAGVPENGQLFPEGSKTVKIEWLKKQNPESPYFVECRTSLSRSPLSRKIPKGSQTHTDGHLPSLSTMPGLRRSSPPWPAPHADMHATRKWHREITSSPPIRFGRLNRIDWVSSEDEQSWLGWLKVRNSGGCYGNKCG